MIEDDGLLKLIDGIQNRNECFNIINLLVF